MTIVGFWLFHALVVSLRAAVMDFPEQGELASRRAIVTMIGITLTWLLYLFLRLFDRKPLGVRVSAAFLAAIPCAIAIAAANYYVFNVYDPIRMFDDPDMLRRIKEIREDLGLTGYQEVAEIAVTRYFFLTAWASLYLAIGYAREVREAERVTSRFAQAAQNAELRSLRYQVNPHFLFNTLNSLSSLVIKGQNDRAEAMIQNLASFYRTSLSSDPLEDVTLSEEVELQRRYLEIEAIRYPRRLQTQFDIPSALSDMIVPALILQPLIENAIKHGVSHSDNPVMISISAKQTESHIEIAVADDALAHDGTNNGASNGIGLSNVRDRLEARYGDAARLTATAGPDSGFVATLYLPKAK
ncbi:MAG: histidine kinase [Sphingorhabdus sp.]